MKKEVVFIDMDNVLVDFPSGLEQISEEVKAQYEKDEDGKTHYDDIPGLFSKMKPVEGAHEAIEKLKDRYDLYILSTAPWNNPSAWCDKLNWVKTYFDDIKRVNEEGREVGVFYKRLILSHHKDLCCKDGAFLIDDRPRHGATVFGHRWLHFGPDGKYKNWDEVVDYLTHRVEGGYDIETFCEQHGFMFHSHGHGKWGAFPFYAFDGKGYTIMFTPHDNEVKIDSTIGSFKGHFTSVDELRVLLESMQIDIASIENKAESQKNATEKMNRRLAMANRIATKIQIKYNFRHEKCLEMAMQGDWWLSTKHLSQLTNRHFEQYAQEVIDGIDNGKIN